MNTKKNLYYLITLNLAFLAAFSPVYAEENSNQTNHAVSTTNKSTLKNSPTNEAEKLSTIFPDDTLASYIASLLHVSVDTTVTQQQLDSVKTVSMNNAGIVDLTGMSRLSNLTSINLSNNAITTIDDLRNLTKLTSLTLNNNQITTIDSLENLDELTTLKVEDNQLTSVSLDSMNSLQFAEFQGNISITELSCINLPKITGIYSGNYISNSGVTVNSSILEKLTMKNIPNLSQLVFSELNLQTVELTDLPHLTKLDLRNNHLAEIDMGNISTLTNLYLTGNELNDLDIASYAEANLGLSTLSIGSNDLSQIDYLSPLNNLKVLRISSTNISDLSPLQGKNMTELYIDNTTITSLEPVSTMSNLTKIEAFNTHLTEVENLSNLDKLTTLLIQNNAYLQRVELDGLNALKQMDIENCTVLTELTMKNLASVSRFYDFKEANSDITIANTPNLQKVTLEALPALAGDISIKNRERLADITIKEIPQITRVYLDNNGLTAFPDITGLSPATTYISAQCNHISSIEEGDMADDLHSNTQLVIDLTGQKITSKAAKNLDNVATINNQITAWGKKLSPQSISDNGRYANEELTWNNLAAAVTSTSYTFSTAHIRTSFTGTVTVPIVQALPAPIISANTEINYQKNSSVTEAKFLSDIAASTSDGSVITSDFPTAVNFEIPGDYQVTLQSINSDGVSAVPFQVTVHIEKSPAPVISADSEVSYAKFTNVSEETFLQDIHAQVDDVSVITSNFDIAVNLEVPGDYQVMLNSTNSDGVSAVPFQVTVHIEKSPAPVISADSEVSYAKFTNVSEEAFLQDIHAQVDDVSVIISDFATVVNFEAAGDYQVTLQSTNSDGVSATPFQVTVHIENDDVPVISADKEITYEKNSSKSEAVFLEDVHALITDSSKITTDFEEAVNFSKVGDYQVKLESALAEPVYVVVHIANTAPTEKVDLPVTDTPLNVTAEEPTPKSGSILPATGDSILNTSLMVTLGISIVAGGIYLLRRFNK
ncbi:hypothetical protein BOQ23_04585 [Listeria monocytogenes]|nr:hypothetical protein [Listeria monocytogenes]